MPNSMLTLKVHLKLGIVSASNDCIMRIASTLTLLYYISRAKSELRMDCQGTWSIICQIKVCVLISVESRLML